MAANRRKLSIARQVFSEQVGFYGRRGYRNKRATSQVGSTIRRRRITHENKYHKRTAIKRHAGQT